VHLQIAEAASDGFANHLRLLLVSDEHSSMRMLDEVIFTRQRPPTGDAPPVDTSDETIGPVRAWEEDLL
jgi:hypothetical protein